MRKQNLVSTIIVSCIVFFGFLMASISPVWANPYSGQVCTVAGTTTSTMTSGTITKTTSYGYTSCSQKTSQGIIGYIGCSNTQDSVTGYWMVSNHAQFWLPYNTYGGTFEQWANASSIYWQRFDDQIVKAGQPSMVWAQMCENKARLFNYATVQITLLLLREHAPNATIYLSPLNTFEPYNLCSITGPSGVTHAINFTNRAVSDGLAQFGPFLGPLTSTNTIIDKCHPNIIGQTLLGNQLVAFFDHDR